MGVGAVLGGLLGLHSANQARKQQKEAQRAAEAANKVKAVDLLPKTTSQEAEAAKLGSADRKAKRRGKTSLTIERDGGSTGANPPRSSGTGLNIG